METDCAHTTQSWMAHSSCELCGEKPVHDPPVLLPNPAASERDRIVRELENAALYSVSMSDGTHWYLDVEDAIAIVRGERDE